MPNHFVNQVLILDDNDAEDRVACWQAILDTVNGSILKTVLPQPASVPKDPRPNCMSEAEVDWRCRAWGTKWDIYDAQPVREIGGDMHGVIWAFETAWSAPSEDARERIAAWLAGHGAQRVIWIGLDPCDDSAKVLGTYDFKEA